MVRLLWASSGDTAMGFTLPPADNRRKTPKQSKGHSNQPCLNVAFPISPSSIIQHAPYNPRETLSFGQLSSILASAQAPEADSALNRTAVPIIPPPALMRR